MVRSPLVADAVEVLLIQARSTRDMVEQEQHCFLRRCRLRPGRLQTANVAQAAPSPALLEGADALLIGGAGEYSAADDYPWMPALLNTVREAASRGLPTFGSCWGHQIIARALGGTVRHDPDHAEMGCHPVELTDAGASDVLLQRFPQRFMANMGHHDRVVKLPPSAVELARNRQPNQAFRLRDRPVYGTQFHSELDRQAERERLVRYRDEYREVLPTEEAFREVLARLVETPAVDALLYDFLATFAAGSSAPICPRGPALRRPAQPAAAPPGLAPSRREARRRR
jgi:GMP synthase (glutamine-hydrolysing)